MPGRASNARWVSASNGAEPEMNRRMLRHISGEIIAIEQARRRSARPSSRCLRQAVDHAVGVETRQEDPRTAEQRAVQRDEQTVHMEDRQCVQQHVVAPPAPVVVQHLRVDARLAWLASPPERPVVPEVYRIAASSSGLDDHIVVWTEALQCGEQAAVSVAPSVSTSATPAVRATSPAPPCFPGVQTNTRVASN